jgi:hypothetical protein
MTGSSLERGYSEGASWPPRAPIDVLESPEPGDFAFLLDLAVAIMHEPIRDVDLLGLRG